MQFSNFFLIFIPLLGSILLIINFMLAPHEPDKEKKSPFECGYHSFLGQTRAPFTIAFFNVGIFFIVFDIEIVAIFPFGVEIYANDFYGLVIMILFTLILALGFIFELGKGALTIYSRQSDFFRDNKQMHKYRLDQVENMVNNSIGLRSDISPVLDLGIEVINYLKYVDINQVNHWFEQIATNMGDHICSTVSSLGTTTINITFSLMGTTANYIINNPIAVDYIINPIMDNLYDSLKDTISTLTSHGGSPEASQGTSGPESGGSGAESVNTESEDIGTISGPGEGSSSMSGSGGGEDNDGNGNRGNKRNYESIFMGSNRENERIRRLLTLYCSELIWYTLMLIVDQIESVVGINRVGMMIGNPLNVDVGKITRFLFSKIRLLRDAEVRFYIEGKFIGQGIENIWRNAVRHVNDTLSNMADYNKMVVDIRSLQLWEYMEIYQFIHDLGGDYTGGGTPGDIANSLYDFLTRQMTEFAWRWYNELGTMFSVPETSAFYTFYTTLRETLNVLSSCDTDNLNDILLESVMNLAPMLEQFSEAHLSPEHREMLSLIYYVLTNFFNIIV